MQKRRFIIKEQGRNKIQNILVILNKKRNIGKKIGFHLQISIKNTF